MIQNKWIQYTKFKENMYYHHIYQYKININVLDIFNPVFLFDIIKLYLVIYMVAYLLV